MSFVAYVITRNPSDYPGKYVLRRHHAVAGDLVPEARPVVVADNLKAARWALPTGLVRMPIEIGHDPVIVEWWI
jgi:hypothetical protein